jgi:curved DNA-binding protein CbpA
MDIRTHYDNLQIKENASDAVIRAAYRALSQKYHPDRNPNNPEQYTQIMGMINKAYQVLSDPELRAKHDRWIKVKKEQYTSGNLQTPVKPQYNDTTSPASSSAGSFDQTWKDLGDSRASRSAVRNPKFFKRNKNETPSGDQNPGVKPKQELTLLQVLACCIVGGWFITLASKAYHNSSLVHKAWHELIIDDYFLSLFVFRTAVLMGAASIVWTAFKIFKPTRKHAPAISGIATSIFWWFLFSNPDGLTKTNLPEPYSTHESSPNSSPSENVTTKDALTANQALEAKEMTSTNDLEIEAELQTLSKKMNATMPTGGPVATIVSVSAGPGKRFKYLTVVPTLAEEWTVEMKEQSRRIAINSYCTAPNMEAFKSFGVTVSWETIDKNGGYVLTNTVTPAECAQ